MILKDGLYLFPDGKGFAQYGYRQFAAREMGFASSGSLLIDFLDFNLSEIISLIKRIESFNGSELDVALFELGDENVITFLIKLMIDNACVKVNTLSAEDCDEKYKVAVLDILNSVVATYDQMWELADYYSIRYGSTEERFDYFHAISESFTTMAVEEIISARKPGRDFFSNPSEDDYCFPYTRAYRFTELQNYVQFLFLNMMQSNSNFCKCNYCFNFFIPKTKKLTRFCDRINPESGKTCKEIAPTIYRNEDIGSNKVLKEYNLALRRNYKRMCRGEERLPGTSSDKDIDPKTYFDWRDRALKAMKLWKGKEISDAEFLNIVKELD